MAQFDSSGTHKGINNRQDHRSYPELGSPLLSYPELGRLNDNKFSQALQLVFEWPFLYKAAKFSRSPPRKTC